MTKARDLANIISGGFTEADIPNLSAGKITSGTFADARIAASNVSQHATSFDDNKIVNDISTLAIRQASNENKAAYNTNSMFVDVFQDSTGISSHTTSSRNASEYVSSISDVVDANTKALWTTQIDNHGDAIGGSPGTPIVDATGTLQLQGTNTSLQTFGAGNAAPPSGFGTKSIRTASWDIGSNNKGYHIREVSGQTSDLNFGTGAYTIEMWVKQAGSGNTNSNHQYVFDLADNAGNNRSTMAPYHSTANASAYSGSALGSAGGYSWNSFQVGSWRYVAYVRDGSGNVSNFIDGFIVATTTGDGSRNVNYTDSNYLGIGMRNAGENAGYLYINNIRISNVARYDPTQSSMTAPTSRFSYLTSTLNATGNFISNAITAPSSTSKMGAIITYQDNAGTNALNTDIVLQLSADGGSNYSTATLTALPDFATGIKMAKVNDLSVTAGTSLNYKISFANQASGSKEARIRGVSLQY